MGDGADRQLKFFELSVERSVVKRETFNLLALNKGQEIAPSEIGSRFIKQRRDHRRERKPLPLRSPSCRRKSRNISATFTHSARR